MGRKPVLTLAGSVLTSLALAGCQSTAPTPSPFAPGATVTKGNITPNGPTITTVNGQPINANQSAGNGTVQINGQAGQSTLPNQSGTQYGQQNFNNQPLPNPQYAPITVPGRTNPPATSSVAIPASPSPVLPGSQFSSQQQAPQNVPQQAPATFNSNSSMAPSNYNPYSQAQAPVAVPPGGQQKAVAAPAMSPYSSTTANPSAVPATSAFNLPSAPQTSTPGAYTTVPPSQPVAPPATTGFAVQQSPDAPPPIRVTDMPVQIRN